MPCSECESKDVQITFLRKALKNAPHDEECAVSAQFFKGTAICACWKSRLEGVTDGSGEAE